MPIDILAKSVYNSLIFKQRGQFFMTKNQYKVNTNLDEEVVENYGENIRGYKKVQQTKTDSIKNQFYEVSHKRNKPNSKDTQKQVKVSRLKKERAAVRLAEIDNIQIEEADALSKYGERKYSENQRNFKEKRREEKRQICLKRRQERLQTKEQKQPVLSK